MRVPTTKSEGLYLKFFVLKIDGSDKAALPALLAYAIASDNAKLRADIKKHLKSLGVRLARIIKS